MVVGPFQLVVIAVLVLLFFGASRLSEVGRSLGQGVRSLRKGFESDADADDAEPESEPAPKPKRLRKRRGEDSDPGVPARRRVAAKKPVEKKLAAKEESGQDEDRDEDPEEEKGS